MKGKTLRFLALILAVIMIIGIMPMSLFATGKVTNYDDFLTELKQLEIYAAEFYAKYSNKTIGELVLNFIRTGVDRYLDGNWATLAGEEIKEFTAYVEEQDKLNGTTVMRLRDIVVEDFILPNGNQTDFGHMFGTMNISYVNSAIQTDDLSGWAGDLCDLLYYCARDTIIPSGTVDEMAEYILNNTFGVDAEDAFGWDDFYGDMDAYYLINEYQKGRGSFSALMVAYFTESLSDADRAAYFLNTRFAGKLTKDDIRSAVYDVYRTNVGIQVLEADRGLTDCGDLRKAACYAFADYLYSQAEDRLVGGGDVEDPGKPSNGYFSVFSTNSSILAPGITQDIKYAMSADGKQMVYYVATVDVNRDDVTIMANYNKNDPSLGWAMQRVEDQAKALQDRYTGKHENFRVVVATNADGFNMTTGEPGGLLVMDGKEWYGVDNDGFFAILDDGSAMIGTKADYAIYKDRIKEAVGGFGATLVKDGEIVTTNNSGRASRTAIGITAEGKVVMMVLDGRQEPFSCGGSMVEIAHIMKEAGCVYAINLDGGGSSTYVSKPEGSDTFKVINRPCDGYARSVATSLVAVSTAKPSDQFDRAIIETEYEYVTPGTSIQISAIGVNNIGSSAAIPANAYWRVSDSTVGKVSPDGTFTGLAVGETDVELIVDGISVGGVTIYVVIPDAIGMSETSMNIIYEVSATLPLYATYHNNPVAIKPEDFFIVLEYDNAGTIDGFKITASAGAAYKSFMAGAMLLADQSLITMITLNCYSSDEAIFDFDNITAGNRSLAWIREIYNVTAKDDLNFEVTDPNSPVSFTYKFGLDMSALSIPSKLDDLIYMLPGADTETASAWKFLLSLAERVSVLTEVKITAQFDKNVVLDISELKVINDFFELTSATVDANNVLTIVCNWVDQTQAIKEETANPLCILTGIKATVKDGAAWDGNELIITNTGKVSYDIYLRASSLYSFAKIEANQIQYGLYPYTTDKTGYEGGTESGAHFSDVYADFEDSMILDKTLRQGWYTIDGEDFYYVDHEVLTGTQYLPAKGNASEKRFYHFDDNGVCLGTVSGIIEYEGELYYSVNGVMTTGWVSTYDKDGNMADYFFHHYFGYAVDGEQTIYGYNYVFTDHVLTRGDLVKTAEGWRYRWADQWVHGKWFEVDGKLYCTTKYNTIIVTGFQSVLKRDDSSVWEMHYFDENGVFQSDYNGLLNVGEDTYLVRNGIRVLSAGLVKIGDDYYYFSTSTSKAVKNGQYWVSATNYLMPQGAYLFDENGKMLNPPGSETPDIPESPDVPEIPGDPDAPVLNGIVEVGGELRYYVDGVWQRQAGLVQLTDEEGHVFYIYVRTSTGTLALGNSWPSKLNGLLPGAWYDFGEDGKYYPETPELPETPEEPGEILNGIVEIGGKLYYYVNGNRYTGYGVVEIKDEEGKTCYIYISSSTGTVCIGRIWVSNSNGLLPNGWQEFGENGKYYPETPELPETPEEPGEILNGVVEIGGKLYYYVNGVRYSGYGVVECEDENGEIYYIYISSSTGTVCTGRIWVTNSNGLLPAGWNEFGVDGKLYPTV